MKACRKLARARELPPVLLLWVSGLDAHVVLDGHDRLVAASAEQTPMPVLSLEPIRSDEQSERMRAGVSAAAANLPTASANSLLLDAFCPLTRAARTRAWPLPGGVEAWKREVERERSLQKARERSSAFSRS